MHFADGEKEEGKGPDEEIDCTEYFDVSIVTQRKCTEWPSGVFSRSLLRFS
jgi:hypothetical protein